MPEEDVGVLRCFQKTVLWARRKLTRGKLKKTMGNFLRGKKGTQRKRRKVRKKKATAGPGRKKRIIIQRRQSVRSRQQIVVQWKGRKRDVG